MALLKINHTGGCDKLAFFLPAIPVGRPIQAFDAVNEDGVICAQGNIVICMSCDKKVNLDTINDYYEVPKED